jgi:DNA-binding transcriptional MerR regulator
MDHLAAQSSLEGKSSLAFRTISEVSVEIDVPQHVLRFWESRFSQVRPMKRGGGRRYYRPEDVELLRQIKTYLYKHGYTIKGVQRLLKEHRISELPSLSAYRMAVQDVDTRPAGVSPLEADLAVEAADVQPDDFEQTFEVTVSDITTPEPELEVHDTQMENSLAAITRIHEELEIPNEPIRVDNNAGLTAPVDDMPLAQIASKETGYVSAPAEMASAQPQPAQPAQSMSPEVKAEMGEILAELKSLRELLAEADDKAEAA